MHSRLVTTERKPHQNLEWWAFYHTVNHSILHRLFFVLFSCSFIVWITFIGRQEVKSKIQFLWLDKNVTQCPHVVFVIMPIWPICKYVIWPLGRWLLWTDWGKMQKINSEGKVFDRFWHRNTWNKVYKPGVEHLACKRFNSQQLFFCFSF